MRSPINSKDAEIHHGRLEEANDAEERSLTLHFVSQPGVTHSNIPILTCAFMAALTTGATSYSFGMYAAELKWNLQLTQSQLDTLSSAIFCAGIFSWVPGLIVDRLGTRVGTVSGGLLGTVSLCCYWAVATKFFAVERSLIIPVLSFLGVLIFLSCALITGSVFKIIVTTCGAGSKGSAVGAAKGYVGLGSGVYACIFESLKSNEQSDLDFLIMAAIFFTTNVTIPGLLLMPSHVTVKEERFHDEATPLHFRALFCSLAAMATIIIASSLNALFSESSVTVGASSPHDDKDQNIPLAIFLLTIWIGPILGLQFMPNKSSLEPVHEDEEQDGERLLTDNADTNHDNASSSCRKIRKRRQGGSDENLHAMFPSDETPGNTLAHDVLRLPQNDPDDVQRHSSPERTAGPDDSEERGGDKNLWQMLQTPTALLLFWTFTILAGGGILMTNNMGQMVEALHFPKAVTAASLAFFSVAQSGGRVLTGALSESALNWNTKSFCIDNGIPRPFFLGMAAVTGFIAHTLLALATSRLYFVVGATLAGLAFGMIWPLMVLVVGEVFGTANVGANYMFFDGISSAAGSVLLSKFLAQTVYESNIDKKDNPENVTCLGSACFSMTHLVVGVLSLSCIFTSMCLLHTTRQVYNNPLLHKDH